MGLEGVLGGLLGFCIGVFMALRAAVAYVLSHALCGQELL